MLPATSTSHRQPASRDVRAAAAASGISVAALTSEPVAAQAAVDAAVALNCPLVVDPYSRVRRCAARGRRGGRCRRAQEARWTSWRPGFRPASGSRLIFRRWPSLTRGSAGRLPRGRRCAGCRRVPGCRTCRARRQRRGRRGRAVRVSCRQSGCTTIRAAKTVIESRGRARLTGPRSSHRAGRRALPAHGSWRLLPRRSTGTEDVLRRAVGARTRLQGILEDLAQPFTFAE